MRARFAVSLLLASLLAAAGCGPIIGQVMKASTGVKDFTVVSGSVKDFGAGGTLLVFAPFKKSEGAYFISRGEDEWLLADGFKNAGLFKTLYAFERDTDAAAALVVALRAATPEQAQKLLALPVAPDAFLTGVLLARDENVAPMVGVIEEMRMRLELTNLTSHKTTSVEIAVKALHKDTIPMLVREIVSRVRG